MTGATRRYDLTRDETPESFIETTWEYVRWGDREVEAGRLTVEEQSRRIRAALGDAIDWIERGGPYRGD